MEMSELYRCVLPGLLDITLRAERSVALDGFFDPLHRYAGKVLHAHCLRDSRISREISAAPPGDLEIAI